MLRAIFEKLEVTLANKTGETFIPINEITPSLIYQYVMQETFKLYRDSEDPSKSNNPVVKAFGDAAKLIKEIDDRIGDVKDINKSALETLQARLEASFKGSPVYRYVKAYLYDYAKHDANRLTLFKRKSVDEILPDNLTKTDLKIANYSLDKINSIMNDFVTADLTNFIINDFDKQGIDNKFEVTLNTEEFKLDGEETPEEIKARTDRETETSELKARILNERVVHENEKQRTETSVNSYKEDELYKALGIDLANNEEFLPLNIFSHFEDSATTLDFNKDKIENKDVVSQGVVKKLLSNPDFVLNLDYFKVKLNMLNLFSKDSKKIISFYNYLKSKGRSSIEYISFVNTFANKLAWLLIKYKDNLIIDGIEIKSSSKISDVEKQIAELYLDKGALNIKVSESTPENQFKASVRYTTYFKRTLINRALYELRKSNPVATRNDAVEYIKDLLNNTKDDSKQLELNKLINGTHKEVSFKMRNNTRSLLFADSLNTLIRSMNEFEQSIKDSIEPKKVETNPATRAKALLESQEVRGLLEELASVSDGKDPSTYNHVFFKLLHLMNNYITEDYASKKILPKLDSFKEIYITKDDDLVFKLEDGEEFSVFDLIYLHRINVRDYTDLVNNIIKRMPKQSESATAAILAKANSDYKTLLQTFGSFLTNASLNIDKEVFLKQGGTEKEYEIISDPQVLELSQRLGLLNNILQKDSKDKTPKLENFYDLRVYTIIDHLENSLLDNTSDRIVFSTSADLSKENKDKVKLLREEISALRLRIGREPELQTEIDVRQQQINKIEDRKVLFELSKVDNLGKARSLNTLFLLSLIKINNLSDKDMAGLKNRVVSGTDQSVLTPSKVKQIIRNIFFYDVKPAVGKAQTTWLDTYEKRIETLEKDKQRYVYDTSIVNRDYAIRRIQSKINNYKALLNFYKEINSKIAIDPNKDFNAFYNVITDSKNENLAETYFNSTYDTDREDRVLVNVNGSYRVASKDKLTEYYKNKNVSRLDVTEGIAELNDYLINNVINKDNKNFNRIVLERARKSDNWKTFVNLYLVTKIRKENLALPEDQQLKENSKAFKDLVEKAEADALRVVTEDGSVVVVVPDEYWLTAKGSTDENTNMIKRLLNDNYNEHDIFDVFILSETKYKQMTDLHQRYFKQGVEYPMVNRYEADDTLEVLPPFINVKSAKTVVDVYVKDLKLLSKQTNVLPVINKLTTFYDLVDRNIVPVLKAYNEGINLFNTNTFKTLQEDARISLMLYEFYDLLGINKNFDLAFVGTYFNGKYISKEYNLDNLKDEDPVTTQKLKSHTINGSNMFDLIYNALKQLQAKYGDSDLKKVTFQNALKVETLNNFVNLKNIIYSTIINVEKGNRTIQKKVMPALRRLLKEQMGEEERAGLVINELKGYKEYDTVFVNALENAFKNPYTTKINIEEIFDNVANKEVASGISTLDRQQFYKDIIRETSALIKRNHRNLIINNKNKNLNYGTFTALRNIFRDYGERKITLDEFSKYMDQYVKIDPGLYNYFDELATDIWKKNQQDVIDFGIDSKERLTKHLVYGYAIKSYLVSIKQFMDRDPRTITNMYSKVLFTRDIRQILYATIFNKTPDMETILNWNTGKNTPEKLKIDRTKYTPEVLNTIDQLIKLIEKNENRPDKSIRYKINEAHNYYRGNTNKELFEFISVGSQGPRISEVYKQDITISDYIRTYILNNFKYEIPEDQNENIITNTDLIISRVTDLLYETKGTLQYIAPLPEMPTNFASTKAIEEELVNEGFNEDEIKLIFKLSGNLRKGIIVKDQKEIDTARILSDDKNKLPIANDYINRIVDARINNAKLNKLIKPKKRDVKNIIDINTIDLLNNNYSFLKRFTDYLRGEIKIEEDSDIDFINRPSFKRIYNTFKYTGINKRLLERLLTGEYKNLNHFLNDYVKTIPTTSESVKQANLLMLLINYLKQEFIYEVKDVNYSELDRVKDMLSFETITERSNTLDFIKLNIAQIFGTGTLTTNSITFSLNKGFDIINSINSRVAFANDRLGRIILDDERRHTEYDSLPRTLQYRQNNLEKVAATIEHNSYEPLFRTKDAGFLGNRNFQLLLEREVFSRDMIAENEASSYDTVQSAKPVYNNIRKTFTEVLSLVKLDFVPRQFIRVIDVASGIKLFEENRDSIGFYLSYFDGMLNKAKQKYINDNINSGKSVDVLENEFDLRLNTALKEVVSLFGSNNLTELTTNQVKALIALIYTQRFESAEYYDKFNTTFKAFMEDQLLNKITAKQYKFRTVSDQVRRVVFDDVISDAEKRKQLAAIQGFDSFDKLGKEEQDNINSALERHKLIKNRYFETNRWYDTLDVARGAKSLDAAETTLTGRLRINLNTRIKNKTNEINGLKVSLSRKQNSVLNKDRQLSVLTVDGKTPVHGYTNDPQLLENHANHVEGLLIQKLSELQIDLKDAKREFREENTALVKELFKIYPGLHEYFVKKYSESQELVLKKLEERLEKLNKSTKNSIIDAYKAYIKDKEEIKTITDSLTYKVMTIIGKPGTEDASTIFDIFKPELESLIKDAAELKTVIDSSVKVFDRLKELRDGLSKHGTGIKGVNRSEYTTYVNIREKLNNDINKAQNKLEDLGLGITDTKDEKSYVDALTLLSDIINEYKDNKKIARETLFKDVDEGNNIIQLADSEKKSLLGFYTGRYNQHHAYLREYYNRLRNFTKNLGVALPEVKLDADTKVNKLIEAIANENNRVENYIGVLTNKKVANTLIPKYITEVELPEHNQFKNDFLYNVALELVVKYKAERIGRQLTEAEINAEKLDLNIRFAATEDTNADVLTKRNFIKNFIETEGRYNTDLHSFGSVGLNLELNSYKDPLEQRYASTYLNNINNALLTKYNDVINKRIESINKIITLGNKNIEALEIDNDSIDRLQNKNTIADKERTRKLFNNMFNTNNRMSDNHKFDKTMSIDDKTLDSLIKLLISPQSTNRIVNINKEINEVKSRLNKVETLKNNINAIPLINENIKQQEKVLSVLNENLTKADKEFNKLLTNENTKHGEKQNNLDLFKAYYDLQNEKNPKVVLDKVLELVAGSVKNMTKEDLEKYIKARSTTGEIELHNSVVDSLITYLNFIHQKGKEEVVVLDLETYKENGDVHPYQITMIYRDKEGNLIINDVYINSGIFYDLEKQTDGTLIYGEKLNDFYEQQKKIWSKEYERDGISLTPEAFEKQSKERMDKLITRIQTVKNNSNFIEAFIRITNPSNQFNIVAHNGNEFDFVILENFISTIGRNLLVNEYYRNIKSELNIQKMYERITSREDITSQQATVELKKELETKLLKLEQDLLAQQNNLTYTRQDLKLIDDSINAILKELLKINIRIKLNEASRRVGYIVDDNLRERIIGRTGSVIKELSSTIFKYFNEKDLAKKEAFKTEVINKFMMGVDAYKNEGDALKTVTDYVDNLLKLVESSYLQYINDNKIIEFNRTPTSARTAANQNVYDELDKKGIKIYDNDIKINITEQLQRVRIGIENLNNLKAMLAKGTKVEDIVKDLESQRIKLNDQVEVLKAGIKSIQDRTVDLNSKEIYDTIYKASIKIYNKTKQFYGKLNKILNNIDLTGFDNGSGVDYITTLSNQRVIIQNNINGLLETLRVLVENVKDGTAKPEQITAKLEMFLDIRVVDALKNPEKINEVKQSITKELETLKPDTNKGITITDANKAVLESVFNKIKNQHQTILNESYESLKDLLLKLNTIKELNTIFKVVDGKIYINDKELTVQLLKEFYFNKLTVDQNLADQNKNLFGTVIKEIKNFINTNAFVSIKSVEDLFKSDDSKVKVFYDIINNYRNGLEQSLIVLNNYDSNNNLKVQDNLVAAAYNKLLSEINLEEAVIENIKETTITSMVTGQKPSKLMSNEEYRRIASTSLNIDEISKTSKKLQELNLGVYYDSANKGDAINVLRLLSNTIYGKKINVVNNNEDDDNDQIQETTTKDQYVFHSFDDLSNESSSFRYNPESKEVTFTFKYAYITKPLKFTGGGEKGYETVTKIITIEADDIDKLKRFKDTFYWKPGITDDDSVIIQGMPLSSLYFEQAGKDTGKESIDALINFYIENKSVFAARGKDESKLKKIESLYNSSKVLNHENFSLDKNYVRVINISKRIETLFLNRVAMLNSVERTPTKLKEIYSGIYNSVTSKYKALEPDSMINQISAEYTIDYNLKKIDHAFLREHNILLELSSEGSAASVLKYKPKFSFRFPFIMNTNPVRTTLSFQHILAKYTTIGVLNKMYKDITATKGSIAPGKHLLNTFINDPKYMENQDLRNRLIRKGNNVNTQIFMPNVMTKELYNEYKEDSIVHQFGMTVPVSFIKDERIPLDVIGIDAEYAKAMGWGDGDKTWLGLHYGFKGAVTFIPNLYKEYGSYFAARAESVVSRGTAGVYGEMLFNNIRAFLLNETDNTGKAILPDSLKSLYSRIEPELKETFGPLMNNDAFKKDNVLLVDAKEVDELFEAVNNALSKLPEYQGQDKNKLYLELITEDFAGKDITRLTPAYVSTKDTIKYDNINENYNAADNVKRVFVKANLKKGNQIRGYVYVFADNEHSAQSMQTITKVNSAGKLVLNITDGNNSVTKGLSISPTVLYAMLPKVGERIFEVFPPEDTVVKQLATVKARGFANYVKEALNITEDEDFNLEEKYKALDELQLKNQLHPYIYEQAQRYLNFLKLSKNSLNENTVYNKQIEKQETEVMNKIVQKLYDGTNGAYYRMNFKRYDGIRQQFLADVELKLGEIVVSKAAWEHIVNKNTDAKKLINVDVLGKADIKEYFDKLNQYTDESDRQNYLTSRGILKANNEKLWADLKNAVIKTEDYAEVKQSYAYVLAARSPVQDTGAVPVFKVIGFSTSYAAKVNPYAYSMMGADNDGDTFGMALIETKHVDEGGALRPLLATDPNYYSFDEEVNNETGELFNYITEQNAEMFGRSGSNINLTKNSDGTYSYNMEKVEPIDYRYTRNYTGKNTFRARNIKNYTEIELLKQLDENIFNDLASKVQKDGLLDLDINQADDRELIRRYINVFIRMNNKGKDTTDTFSIKDYNLKDKGSNEKLIEFFNNNKDNILTLYTVEEGLKNNEFVYGKDIVLSNKELIKLYYPDFTNDEQAILIDSGHENHSKLMKRLIKLALNEQAQMNTIARIRVSKNGVNYGGNKRKDQMIASHISMYPNINKSKTGYFWKVLGAANNEGEVTVDSLINSLFFKDKKKPADVIKFVKNNIKMFKDVTTLKTFIDKQTTNDVIKTRNTRADLLFYFKDYDMILKDVVDLVSKYESITKELVDLQDLWNRKILATKKDVINFLENSSKKNDVIMSVYLDEFKRLKDANVKVDETVIKEIAAQYFNNVKSLNEFLDGGSAESFAEGYLKQYLIERVALNNLSKSMNKIISVAKHDGLDSDPVEKYNAYKAEVDEQTTKKSLRKVIYGIGLEHKIGFSIMVDRHVNKKFKIKYDGLNNSRLNREYFSNSNNKPVEVLAQHTDSKSTVNNINDHIKARAKMVLFGNMFIPESLIKTVIENVKVLNTALINPNAITGDIKKDLIKTIVFFNRHGIPFYKLVRWVLDSRSILLSIKSDYEAQIRSSKLDTNNVILNNKEIKNLYSFLYRLKDSDYKEAFDGRYKDEAFIYNFFNNVNELDETMYYLDEAGNVKSVRTNDYDTSDLDLLKESFDDASIHASRDAYNSFAGADNMKDSNELSTDKIDAVVLKENKEALELSTFESAIATNRELLDDVRQEFETLLKLKSTIDEKYLETQKNLEGNRFKTTADLKFEDTRVKDYISYNLIADEIRTISEKSNEYISNKKEIEKLNKQLEKIQVEINTLEERANNLSAYIDYFKQGNNLENKIDEDLKLKDQDIERLQKRALDKALSDNLGGGILLLRDNEGNGIGDATIKKPKYLTQDDFNNYRNESLLALSNEVTLLKNMVDPNNADYNLKVLYDFMKKESSNYRLVIVMPPESDEGLYKDVLSNIRKYDPEVDDVLYSKKSKQDLYFKDLDDVQKWKGKVVFNNRVYDKLDPKVIMADNKVLSPTIKQIDVKSFADFKAAYEQHIRLGSVIGFIDQDRWMKTMEKTYNVYRTTGLLSNTINRMQNSSKFRSRLSFGGILRNAGDTVFQLFTNFFILPKVVDSKDFLRVTMKSGKLLSSYEFMSNEHTLAIMNIGAHYEDILKQIKSGRSDLTIIKNKIDLIKEVLESYVLISATISDNDRITFRANNAKKILENINKINIDEIANELSNLKSAVTFISNIQFGEFYDMYDNRKINNTWVAGLRVDSKDIDGKVVEYKSIKDRLGDEYELERSLIKEISAFMNTSATTDYLKKDRFELLPAFFERYRGYQENKNELTYEELKKEFKKAAEAMDEKFKKGIFGSVTKPFVKGFNNVMEHIENSARITNFLYNVLIHGKSFDEAKLDSLKRWFNYGNRTPLEQAIMTDIPFFSFSARSVQNWIDRLVNPRFWRIMSDFIDGWYGQYVDEDTKEYDDFMKYQIRQGWIPLDDNFGIRVGNGAFDVMNTLYNPAEFLSSRRSPILRAVSTLVAEQDFLKSIKQLATFGVIGRIANLTTGLSDAVLGTGLRPAIAQTPVLKDMLETRPARIGTIEPSVFYDIKQYEKYTPRKYRYSRNGRYAKYENIYRDWFTKYGKMRKPKVNPYQMVKDIQWRQYVRWRRSRNVVG
jgi:hypothetical protein